MRLKMTPEEEAFAVRLGAWLREVRLALRMSQTEMAEIAGCHRNSLLHWEKGMCMPNPYQLSQLQQFVKSKAGGLA